MSYYSEFSDRIIIPVHDAYGQPVGITGRLIAENPNRGKYYNSDYPKASTLFNLHRAKQEILKAGYVVVVEGNLDVVAMWDAGIRNVVACTGAFITPKQIRKLLRYTDKVLVATDNDNAGHMSYTKFLKNSAYYIKNGELSAIRIIPPFGLKDPDDFIRKYGAKTCREWVAAGAKHLMDVSNKGNSISFKGVWNGCGQEEVGGQ
jgi:DNA primase